MEYVAGVPITEHCWRHRLGLDSRLRLFRKVCDAVQHAHRNMVLHRDLKPSNILVDESGEPRLLDFGVAKLLDREEDFTPLTSTINVPVTPGYASPEQLRGEPVTAAADVYALGAVLYEMLTSQPAHGDLHGTAIEVAPRAEDPVLAPSAAARRAPAGAAPAADLAGDLDTITLKALRADPRERYLSVEQLSEDVERYLSHLPVRARALTWRYRAGKSLRRHRGVVASTSLIVVTLLAGVVVSAMQAARAQRRFEDVRHLAQAFLFDIDDRLQTVPGTTDVREAIVRTSLTYLDALATEASNDSSLLFEIASGYQKIGDVQGFPLLQNLGQRAAAIESHRKALAIATRLAERKSGVAVQRLLVRGHDRLGTMLQAQSDVAGDHFRRALAIAGEMDRADPENAPLLVDLYGHVGEFETAAGNLTAAMGHSRLTLEISESCAARQPGDSTAAALSVAHWRLSRALQRSGDVDGAIHHGRESVAINEAVAARHPRDVTHRRRLLNSYEQAGYASFDRAVASAEDPVAAVASHTKALSIADSLAAEDPRDVRAISDLAIVQRNICDALSEYDTAGAERSCRAGLMTLARRTAPSQEHRAALLASLAVALNRPGHRAEAQQVMRAAIQLQESLASAEPAIWDRREMLLRMHNHLGDILLDSGEFDGALEQHRRAIGIGEVMLVSRANDLVLRRDLADTYEALAGVSIRRAADQRLDGVARLAHCREAVVVREEPEPME
jgi:eukaryotic-like serine/threonine-protein kinase